MGCGASSEPKQNGEGEYRRKDHNSDVNSSATDLKPRGSTHDPNALGAFTPANNSLSPGSGALSSSNPGLNTSMSSSASNLALAMPVHTVVDSCGHKVTSCIASRSKVDVITRWLDHIMRHRYDNGVGWKNPQDEQFTQKVSMTTASQGSITSDSSHAKGLGLAPNVPSTSPMLDSIASASHLSVSVQPSTPSQTGARETGSNMPQRPSSPRDGLASPYTSQVELMQIDEPSDGSPIIARTDRDQPGSGFDGTGRVTSPTIPVHQAQTQ